ncbi:MAG: hypothetical protein N3D11_15855 [Candidatus Sumerlaeia bacterium]|nr:hypothetical protein [Candidatus Sumerlaeia bacterium]
MASRPIIVEFLDGSLRLGAMVGAEPAATAPVFSASSAAHPSPLPADRAPKHFVMQFDRDYVRVPSAEIRRLIVQPVERFLVRSDTGVATLHLGEGATRRPEPLNWFLPEARIEGWEWAVPQKTFYRWRYIPEACWIWSRRTSRPREDASVLFRQEFRLPTTSTLVGAVLEISADDLIESLFINGVSIPIVKEPLLNRVERWDVTYLLQPGRNVIAARVTNLAGPEQLNYAGLCYRIIGTLKSAGGGARPAPPGVVLLFTNGDRVSGDLLSVSSKQWRVGAAGATLDIDSDWIELALMNYGEEETDAARAVAPRATWLPDSLNLSRVWKGRTLRPAVTARVRSAFAWDLNILPVGSDRGVQARSGDWIEGRIENVLSNRVQVKPRYGETVGIALDRIAFLQPNPPDLDKQFLFLSG